jgi:hypothetical protein
MEHKPEHNSKEYIQGHNNFFLEVEYTSYKSLYIYLGYQLKHITLYTQGWCDNSEVF